MAQTLFLQLQVTPSLQYIAQAFVFKDDFQVELSEITFVGGKREMVGRGYWEREEKLWGDKSSGHPGVMTWMWPDPLGV